MAQTYKEHYLFVVVQFWKNKKGELGFRKYSKKINAPKYFQSQKSIISQNPFFLAWRSVIDILEEILATTVIVP